MQLTQDYKNPYFDGRATSGLRSVRVMKAGELFEIYRCFEGHLRAAWHGSQYPTSEAYWDKEAKEIVDRSVDVEPTLESFVIRSGWGCRTILEEMIKHRFTTVELVGRAIAHAMEVDDREMEAMEAKERAQEQELMQDPELEQEACAQ